MQVTIKKWGNSGAVRIPAAFMEAANFHLDEIVNMHEENGRIIIEPIIKATYELEQLLADITPDNLHAAINFGPAVGKEIF